MATQAQAKGRIVLAATRVKLGLTLARHQQTVEFDIRLDASQNPEFFCIYPVRTLIRGGIEKWIWEPTPDGKTRLWIPTELVWRAVFIGNGIARVIPLDGQITGSARLELYRRKDSWWVAFDPPTR